MATPRAEALVFNKINFETLNSTGLLSNRTGAGFLNGGGSVFRSLPEKIIRISQRRRCFLSLIAPLSHWFSAFEGVPSNFDREAIEVDVIDHLTRDPSCLSTTVTLGCSARNSTRLLQIDCILYTELER